MDSLFKRTNRYVPVDKTRKELLDQEQGKVDLIEVANTTDSPESTIKEELVMQSNQANETSKETINLRNYKKRQIQEYTTDFSINQIAPSPIATILNVINTIILTLAIMIAFFVAFGLLFGLQIGIVPTDSMEDEIHVGALVVTKPLNSIDDIRVGDVLSYVKQEQDGTYKKYIHKVRSVAGGVITMYGANPKYTKVDLISFDAVEGRMILNISGMGYLIAFIRNNLILIIPAVIVLLLGLMLGREIIDRKNMDKQICSFIELKTEYEKTEEQKLRHQKIAAEDQKIEDILNGN